MKRPYIECETLFLEEKQKYLLVSGNRDMYNAW